MINKIKQAILPLSQPAKVEVDLRCAAVLVPLVNNKNGNWQVIFTRRAEHLKHHPGEISFPGGGYEPQDQNLQMTAIRETHEEIGITSENVELLGSLPQQQTISRYYVTPFVGLVSNDYQLSIDANEVAEVFQVPLEFLLDKNNQQRHQQAFNGQQIEYYVIQYQDYRIWGATARILVNLSRRLSQLSAQS